MCAMSGVISTLGVISKAAIAEIRPDIAHTSIRMRDSRMPTICAARGFMPTARMALPMRVRLNMKYSSSMTIIDTMKMTTSSRVSAASPITTASAETSDGSERGVSPNPVWRTMPFSA